MSQEHTTALQPEQESETPSQKKKHELGQSDGGRRGREEQAGSGLNCVSHHAQDGILQVYEGAALFNPSFPVKKTKIQKSYMAC